MKKKPPNRKRRGFVLIVVLVLIAMLMVVLVEFHYEARINLRTMDNAFADYQALAAADGGLQVAMAVLRQLEDTAIEGPAHELFSDGLQLDCGNGARCTVRAVKENGKLNIGELVDADGNVQRENVDRLLALIDELNDQRDEDHRISYGIVPALVDWTDRDDRIVQLPFIEGDNRGAEEGWYRQKTEWPCKNGPLETMAELLLVKGIGAELYGGTAGDEILGRQGSLGLKDLTTIYGDGKVDLNHAPVEVIATFSDRLDPGIAREIVTYREEQPLSSLKDLQLIGGLDKLAMEIIGKIACVNPPDRYYRIEAVGRANNVESRVETVFHLVGNGGQEEILLRREY